MQTAYLARSCLMPVSTDLQVQVKEYLDTPVDCRNYFSILEAITEEEELRARFVEEIRQHWVCYQSYSYNLSLCPDEEDEEEIVYEQDDYHPSWCDSDSDSDWGWRYL